MTKATYLIGISLVLLTILVIFTNMSTPQVTSAAQLQTVGVSEFAYQIKTDNAVLLDIRTPQEFADGKIEGATNLDFYSPSFIEQLQQLDRNAEYKIYCNSGNRSSSALEIMERLGFTNVTELGGGIQAWLRSSQPTCVAC